MGWNGSRRLFVAVALCASVASCGTARVAPPRLALEPARLNAVTEWLEADVAKGRYPGAVVLVAQDGKVVLQKAVGWADKDAKVPMAIDSIHPIASSSKLVTTVAALRLFEANRLQVMADRKSVV